MQGRGIRPSCVPQSTWPTDHTVWYLFAGRALRGPAVKMSLPGREASQPAHDSSHDGDPPSARRGDINTIRAWLGHVSLATTNVYAEVDLEMKAKALANCEVEGKKNDSMEAGQRLDGVPTDLVSYLQ